MMTEAIEPALSEEEWTHREFAIAGDRKGDTFFGYVDVETGKVLIGWNGDALRPVSRLAGLATLCLYGQPFGFTRDDVETLRACASGQEGGWTKKGILRIADRIEALLPPE